MAELQKNLHKSKCLVLGYSQTNFDRMTISDFKIMTMSKAMDSLEWFPLFCWYIRDNRKLNYPSWQGYENSEIILTWGCNKN